MPTFTDKLTCGTIAFFATIFVSFGQANSPAPDSNEKTAVKAPSGPSTNPAKSAEKSESAAAPQTLVQATSATSTPAAGKPAPPQPSTSTPATTTIPPVATDTATESGGVGVREFQGDDVGQVLRLLARQAKINMVVSDQVTGTVTMRLEDVTALQAIAVIVKAKGLFMDQIEHVYYIKTAAEKTAEPTESDNYQFSYSRAKEVAPLLASQLSSKEAPQFDERTNTIFFRETRSNIDTVRKLLVTIDKPTKQVMIEARLVEVTANPRQSYGINWAGTVGSSTNAQTFSYGAPANTSGSSTSTSGNIPLNNFALGNPANNNILGNFSHLALGQFAILSVPQMSATLRFLNEDNDAEFLANPRVVTADNLQAKIEINRAQPVPQLNFNEQTATAVFGGFQDKKFGNTLIVTPSINKDNFVTMKVKPEISNKVGDSTFVFAGATVSSPIIDTRTLESNVLIRSGDTLAIGGLLQDEVGKARNKVPLLGDVPVLGYLFQERLNNRVKRNLLVFVTPTIINSKYGTGLEDQVNGLHHVGEEYSDINGWRNNAKGAVRLVPTGHRQVVADYPKPGTPPPPAMGEQDVQFKSSAKDRDF
jgi:type IV pilus secretin PilQ/predicted competence protein